MEGQEFVSNKYNGVGSSQAPNGVVSSPVAGSKLIVSGFAGIAAFKPYAAFILEQI